MKILLVTATSFEIAPYLIYLENNFEKISFFEFQKGDLNIYILVTGVGSMLTSFAMARLIHSKEFDLAINIGLAGAFDTTVELGRVVEVYKDRFADLGIEENDGSFTDLFALELMDDNQFPFTDGYIVNQNKYPTGLQKMDAITVNTVHGTTESIKKIKNKYKPMIESMEGAGFFYTCAMIELPCVQIRAISNHVIPRDKNKWEISLAIENSNDFLKQFIDAIL